jgi:putative heme-binding domain-containing protein
MDLVRAMDTPNGPARDRVQMEWAGRAGQDRKTRDGAQILLRDLTVKSGSAAVRAQALSSIPPSSEVITAALRDRDPSVRCVAMRAAEPLLASGNVSSELEKALFEQAASNDRAVALQAAFSLGEWRSDRVAGPLAQLARIEDRSVRAAVLSSATGRAGAILTVLLDSNGAPAGLSAFTAGLIATATQSKLTNERARVLLWLAPKNEINGIDAESQLEPWRLEAVGNFLETLRRGGTDMKTIAIDQGEGEQTAAKRIEEMLHQVATLAAGPTTPKSLRAAAIKLLGVWDEQEGREALSRLLTSPAGEWHEPAVEALARSREAGTGARLLSGWSSLGPSVRTRVIDVLLNRAQWWPALLSALEKGIVRPTEVNPAQRQRLLSLKGNDEVRARAARIFVSGNSSNRAEILRKFSTVSSLKGVPAAGASVFDKSCGQCHAMRGHGHDVGPNLAEFAGKSPEDFLLAILDPNAGINPNFASYNLELKDGRSLSGLIRHETAASLTLVQPNGLRETILRQELAEMRAADLSLMPEGLEQGMTPQDMADLITWLKGARPRLFGSSSAEQAKQARADFLRNRPARLIEVTRAVERLPYPGWLGRWPMAYCRQNAGQEFLSWKARLAEAPQSSRLVFRFPAAMGFASQPQREFTLKVNGTRCLNFEVVLNDSEWRSADGQVTLRYSVVEASEEDSCGVLEIDVARSMISSDGALQFEVAGSASNSQRWFGLYLIE